MMYSAAMPETTHDALFAHLIRGDFQEDLCFALYNPSTGAQRFTGVLKEILLPNDGERDVHGNVSFNAEYWDRVTSRALEAGCGICFIHSHLGPGWQGMSDDDRRAESMLAPLAKGTTRLPLLGMTLGTDGSWSARFWLKKRPKKYEMKWCESVRVSGKSLQVTFCKFHGLNAAHGEEFSRTISAWGEMRQRNLSQLRVGIVGLGSVGSIVAEALYKTGITHLIFIDFDKVERKNLDRLQGIGENDIGKFKTDVIRKRLRRTKLLKGATIEIHHYSISELPGLRAALDCDVLFSCVDRPHPRYVLDKIAVANCIPVIDGGIDASINGKGTNLDQARWKAHVVGPGRRCMQCLGQYTAEDVALEMAGWLDDPTYITGLPKDHFINRGENVFAFSLGLAGMEMQQFLSLILQPRGIYYGPKEFDFNTGNIDDDFDFRCNDECLISIGMCEGDRVNSSLIHLHPKAESNRQNSKHSLNKLVLTKLKSLLSFL